MVDNLTLLLHSTINLLRKQKVSQKDFYTKTLLIFYVILCVFKNNQ